MRSTRPRSTVGTKGVFLDGLSLKRSWGGEVRNVSLLMAIGVNNEGFREVLAVGRVEGRRGELGALSAAAERPRA